MTDKRALILSWIEEQEAICEAATMGPWYALLAGLPLALAALKAAALEHELKQDEYGWYCKGCEWTLLDGNFCPTIETLYSSLSLQQR